MTTAAAPLRALLADRPLAWRVGVVLVGSWLLAASSWIEAPMYPVPMTMQTYAVLLVAGLAGARLAGEITFAWLAQAAMGLPFLSGGDGGLAHFAGPTGGYLAGFLVAAVLVGWLAERRGGRSWLGLGAGFLLGHAVILAAGFAWLSTLVGPQAAWTGGVAPFLIGSVLKTVLAAASVKLADPRLRRRDAERR
jgi:biotin transport system substrate-specific component